MKNIRVELLWFSERDGNGVVIDSKGNEYYIDTSVIIFDSKFLKRKIKLLVDKNLEIKNYQCAKNVRLA